MDFPPVPSSKSISIIEPDIVAMVLTVMLGEVTTLNHEVLDDTVEGRSLIAKALLTSGESTNAISF